jgi:uncharacterized protein (TIGR03435 family)
MHPRKQALGKLILAAFLAITTPIAFSQATSQPDAKLPTFDIVSIKLSHPETPPSAQFPPNGLHLTGLSLHGLIIVAYLLPGGEILGAPAWADTTAFDLDAKVDPADVDSYQKLTLDQRRLMRQALLADRFKLQIHRQTRQGPVYALIPAKDGVKLRVAEAGDDVLCKVDLGHHQLTMQACPMQSIAVALSQIVERTVIDKSGLPSRYSFTLDWSTDADAPSIFTVIQEQLGLKLDSQRGPVEDIVIDHVEMPSAN